MGHDHRALGFKCGLEIHQQLDTGKLFCRCRSEVVDVDAVDERTVFTLTRRLRPTESELGELDPAARAEARRGLLFHYRGIRGCSCLVEADEEPPHDPDDDAIDITLSMAALLEGRPVDEVQFMRKIVIDGSNTSGFQRTGLVALGGQVEGVGVMTIAVEEDSCRKLDTKDTDGPVQYTLDRLGIPLIEIATAPDIRDPEHAKATAARIGALLRATRRVRRGLGTIRQDLNVSIARGDRVEIKGVQDLRAIPRVIDREVDRQLHMADIKDRLAERGITAKRLHDLAPVDVTAHFAKADSKVVQGALKKKGVVLALPLPGFGGLIKGKTKDGPRLGQEFASYAKKDAGVKGVFHSDELPDYGISKSEVAAVRGALALGADDAFVLSAETLPVATRALAAVLERAVLATERLPREVRNARPDDSTEYLRPLPGAARMYPETDVRPVPVTKEHWLDILNSLPERPEESAKRLVTAHGLSDEIGNQLVAEGHLVTFDVVVSEVKRPSELARLLLQTIPELQSDGVDTGALNEHALIGLLAALDEGRYAKEALGDVAKAYCAAPDKGIAGAITKAGAAAVDADEVRTVIERIVDAQGDFVRERGMAAVGPLMGVVMKELRGKADGALVSQILAETVQKKAK